MSKAWQNGSTAEWRRIRAAVLDRDGRRCRLQLPGCTTVADQVHHTRPRAMAGDDPAHLIAACRHCNASYGAPEQHTPTRPRRWSAWSARSSN